MGVEETSAEAERCECGRIGCNWHDVHDAAWSEWVRRIEMERTDFTRRVSLALSSSWRPSECAAPASESRWDVEEPGIDNWGMLSFTSSLEVMLSVDFLFCCAQFCSADTSGELASATEQRDWVLSSEWASSGFCVTSCVTPFSIHCEWSPARIWAPENEYSFPDEKPQKATRAGSKTSKS